MDRSMMDISSGWMTDERRDENHAASNRSDSLVLQRLDLEGRRRQLGRFCLDGGLHAHAGQGAANDAARKPQMLGVVEERCERVSAEGGQQQQEKDEPGKPHTACAFARASARDAVLIFNSRMKRLSLST